MKLTKKQKEDLIREINQTIEDYKILYKHFEDLDNEIFDKFYRKHPYGTYGYIKRLFNHKERSNLKIKRESVFKYLVKLRDKIVEYERKYKLQLGETPHCCFEEVVKGGYGSVLSRAYGDLAILNENGRFPFIIHKPTIDMFGKGKRKLLHWEISLMEKSKHEHKIYDCEGYDIPLSKIDEYKKDGD